MQALAVDGGEREQTLVRHHPPQRAQRGDGIGDMLQHIQHDDGVGGLAGGVDSLDGALGEINAEPAPALRHRPPGRLHPPRPPSPGAGDFQKQTDVRSRLEQAPAAQRVGADPVEHPSEELSPGFRLVHVRHVLG